MSRNYAISSIISTELPFNEVWNSLLTPDPFPGNLFIEDGATYVCYPLGTGRIGGYRFEYGKHKWLILRLTTADKDNLFLKWDLVDIKKSPLVKLETSIQLRCEGPKTFIEISLLPEFGFPSSIFRFFTKRKIKKKLDNLSI